MAEAMFDRRARGVVILTTLLASACSGGSETPTSPSPGGSTIAYTVLGASDGIGFGGSVVCAPFDLGCENGTGYAQTIRRRWVGQGRTVSYLNLSVPGSVLSPAIVDLASRIGQSVPGSFLERYPPFVPTSTTHVTVFAGGNDANIIGNAAAAGVGGSDVRAFVDTQVRQWANDLAELVNRIRARAPSARIVVFNLPNLAAAPYLASRPVLEKSLMQRIATGLADGANALTSRNVLVVDLMCESRVLAPSSFSNDGFHPSDAGYALMADLAFPALNDGSAPNPAGSCAARSLFPPY
jgi:lysophospholipase L1-like esterase